MRLGSVRGAGPGSRSGPVQWAGAAGVAGAVAPDPPATGDSGREAARVVAEFAALRTTLRRLDLLADLAESGSLAGPGITGLAWAKCRRCWPRPRTRPPPRRKTSSGSGSSGARAGGGAFAAGTGGCRPAQTRPSPPNSDHLGARPKPGQAQPSWSVTTRKLTLPVAHLAAIGADKGVRCCRDLPTTNPALSPV